jgi:uncharacterized protein (TIGR02246 family)
MLRHVGAAAVLSASAFALAPAAEARTAAPRCAPVTTAAVEAQFAKFNAAWATKNPDTVTALFGKDAVLLATVSNKPRTDAAGIRDYFVSFLKNSPVGTITSSNIDLGCNMATRVGTWTVTFTDAVGAKTDVLARYTFIYKYEGGKWMIDHLHSSMLPEKAA